MWSKAVYTLKANLIRGAMKLQSQRHDVKSRSEPRWNRPQGDLHIRRVFAQIQNVQLQRHIRLTTANQRLGSTLMLQGAG